MTEATGEQEPQKLEWLDSDKKQQEIGSQKVEWLDGKKIDQVHEGTRENSPKTALAIKFVVDEQGNNDNGGNGGDGSYDQDYQFGLPWIEGWLTRDDMADLARGFGNGIDKLDTGQWSEPNAWN